MDIAVDARTHQTILPDYLAVSAARHPDRVAVVDPSGKAITYADLEDRSARIAEFLLHRGVRTGDRVGLAMPKSADGMTAIFGILRAGAAYVPVDPGAPAARCRAIFDDCQVRAVFVHQSRVDIIALATSVPAPEIVVVVDSQDLSSSDLAGPIRFESALKQDRLQSVMPALSPDDLAYILYTSGSTGIPKGVMLTHRNATSFVEWCASEFKPSEHDRFSSHAPFHFDLSILDLYLTIRSGGTVYLISEELGRNPRQLGAFIATNRLTVWYSTPSILSLMAEFGGLDRVDCSTLRLVLFAGEVFPIKHLRRVVELWPTPAYFNLYGPTETNVCTFAPIPVPISPERSEPFPIGFPCSHCEALVVDDVGQAVSCGEEGLLYIAGPAVFQGYWNRPAENAAAFLDHDGKRWYNTGDVVRLDPEFGYTYLGRRDRMVKRRGYRIELGEIESALYRHPRLREAAVVANTDPQTGVRIAAFVTAATEPRPSIIELKQFCARELPAYMNPDVFVVLDELPRTSTDKVSYQDLLKTL